MITIKSAKQSRSGFLSRKCGLLALTVAVSLSALLFTACDSNKALQEELSEIKNEISEMKNDIDELKKIEGEEKSEETKKPLEESLEATDAANLRSAYAAVQAAALMQDDSVEGVTRAGDGPGSYTYTATVEAKQMIAGWQNDALERIGGISINEIPAMVQGETWDVVYDEVTNNTTIGAGSTVSTKADAEQQDGNVLENSRESTDAANLRNAYAAVQVAFLQQDDSVEGVTRAGDGPGTYTYSYTVEAKQTIAGWQNDTLEGIGGIPINEIPSKVAGESWTVVCDEVTGATTIN